MGACNIIWLAGHHSVFHRCNLRNNRSAMMGHCSHWLSINDSWVIVRTVAHTTVCSSLFTMSLSFDSSQPLGTVYLSAMLWQALLDISSVMKDRLITYYMALLVLHLGLLPLLCPISWDSFPPTLPHFDVSWGANLHSCYFFSSHPYHPHSHSVTHCFFLAPSFSYPPPHLSTQCFCW